MAVNVTVRIVWECCVGVMRCATASPKQTGGWGREWTKDSKQGMDDRSLVRLRCTALLSLWSTQTWTGTRKGEEREKVRKTRTIRCVEGQGGARRSYKASRRRKQSGAQWQWHGRCEQLKSNRKGNEAVGRTPNTPAVWRRRFHRLIAARGRSCRTTDAGASTGPAPGVFQLSLSAPSQPIRRPDLRQDRPWPRAPAV